jgi:hypothetical protein
MTLNPGVTSVLATASARGVHRTLAGLRPNIQSSLWVGKRNRYTKNTAQVVETELGLGKKLGTIRRPKQLAQYIAASALLHCTDGWSYLGKAVFSLLRGDPHRSRHLAYYAELRAAISLLATQGIGVFSRRHVVVDGPNSVAPVDSKLGTHVFAWECLEFWSGLATSGDLFAKIVRPHGRTLDDWFAPHGGPTVVAHQAQAWLLQWGLDLKLPIKDREARNESSYRPDGIPRAWSIETASTLRLVKDLWLALEPSTESLFGEIDRQVLRISLEKVFRAQAGIEPEPASAQYRAFVTRTIANQSFGAGPSEQWERFLLRQSSPLDGSLFAFSSVAPDAEYQGHAAVISRAALLLRMASGATAHLIRSAGVESQALGFWVEGVGKSKGLWDVPVDAGRLIDLWADIPPLLGEIDVFQGKYAPQDQTFYLVGSELGGVLAGLGSCERVALWSMTP